MNKKRQVFLSQGLWDILEPQCQFPAQLLEELKAYFNEQNLGHLSDRITPYYYIAPNVSIHGDKQLVFVCKWNFQDLISEELGEMLSEEDGSTKKPPNYESKALDFLAGKGFDLEAILQAPDEIVVINDFTDSPSIFTDKVPRQFYCLPDELDGLRRKAIAKLTAELNEKFNDTHNFRPNEPFEFSL